jgi:hypothetical protein
MTYVLLEVSNVFVREVMFLTNYLYRSHGHPENLLTLTDLAL